MTTQRARVLTPPVLRPPFSHLWNGLLEVSELQWGLVLTGRARAYFCFSWHVGLQQMLLGVDSRLPCWTRGLAWRKTP